MNDENIVNLFRLLVTSKEEVDNLLCGFYQSFKDYYEKIHSIENIKIENYKDIEISSQEITIHIIDELEEEDHETFSIIRHGNMSKVIIRKVGDDYENRFIRHR